jgi:AcrR family transcriptional regulator
MTSTDPTEPKPLRADARRNRERIVDAARELFTECGPETQMDDVARRAQVGVGTVYRHFPTKTALIGELLATKFRGHAEVARRYVAVDGGWAPFEGFLREAFASIAQDATMQQRTIWIDDSEILALAEAERTILVEVVGQLIARAHAEGTLREDFTVADIPAVMCAVGAVFAAHDRMSLRADRFVELLIDGMRAG